MTATVRAVEAETAVEAEMAVEAEVAVEAETAEVALAVLPSQGHLFVAALPLLFRPPWSAQRLPFRLPFRLYLLSRPPVWPVLLRAR